ncbi:MAG TPA: protein kinase [Thermoanaerobaculia bacterium]|nr:protein kinase [Thermoanaerobaculia bacterium]
MSTVDPFSPGNPVLHFRLIDRVGATVWQAEDTRNGRKVAIKVLTKQLPKDQGRREALVREARLGGALYHAFLIPILEIVVAGDALLLVMEWVDGRPLSQLIGGEPLERVRFFNLAYQIADALKFLHGKGVVHGNIGGDSILVAANDHVRLAGLNISNILRSPSGVYQQKGTDIRSVAYMSPEQISGQAVDVRTDIYSVGVVMYEMATGRLPHQATAATELARKVVSEAPASPKAVNPSIDAAVMGIIGRSIFKDVFSRYRDAKLLVDDIVKAAPEVLQVAGSLTARPAAAAVTAGAAPRRALLFIGEVADYEALQARDPVAAERAAARMQQVLGEAAYLFDGQVLDPFGPRMIAEMPSVESALEAGRKGEFDFSAEQSDGSFAVRLLLHAGEVINRGATIGGPAIEKAEAALPKIGGCELYLSEDFARAARNAVRLRDAGALGGMKLFSIVPAEPELPSAQTADDEEAVVVEAAPPPRQRRVFLIPIGAAAAVGVLVAVMLLRHRGTPPPVEQASTAPVAAAAAIPVIAVPKLSVEGGDEALSNRADAIRLAALEILRTQPEIRVGESGQPGAVQVTATIRNGGSGTEMIAGSNATPIPLSDGAAGIHALLRAVSQRTNKAALAPSNDVLNAFIEAVEADAKKDSVRTEKALRAAIKADPDFLPAQLMAMNFFERVGKEKDAAESAKQVARLQPHNEKAARSVARTSLEAGDLTTSLAAYGTLLRKGNDLEALNTVARYAVAAGDRQRYDRLAARLGQHPATLSAVHAPDFQNASGQLDAAVNQYYDIEVQLPDNPALALKIGRIAVLRHTIPVAELELEKLQRSDPLYGYHLLRAYLAAEKRSPAEAAKALEKARLAMHPGDDFWTTAAEIHAMLADNERVLDALEKAVMRREPAVFGIRSNSLFAYLRSDERFARLVSDIDAARSTLQTALSGVTLQ